MCIPRAKPVLRTNPIGKSSLAASGCSILLRILTKTGTSCIFPLLWQLLTCLSCFCATRQTLARIFSMSYFFKCSNFHPSNLNTCSDRHSQRHMVFNCRCYQNPTRKVPITVLFYRHVFHGWDFLSLVDPLDDVLKRILSINKNFMVPLQCAPARSLYP
jgi:hypothetical protein